MNATPKPRLRWYQYVLWSLIVLTVLAAGWLAVKRQQVERERAVVRWVEEKRGGRVLYDWQVISKAKQPPGPAWLRELLGDDFFAHVVHVQVADETVTDAELEHVKESLPNCTIVNVVDY